MVRLPGILKVTTVLALDFFMFYALFDNLFITTAITGVIILYVWLGGYLALLKEGAISCKKLPAFEQDRLEVIKAMLMEDVKSTYSVDISKLKIYLIPGNNDMNATAYGANCVSVTRGTCDNFDPPSIAGVLGHEVSHILHSDTEFSRAVFASVTMVVGAFSIISSVTMVIVFLIFLALSCFRSWLGVIAFRGTTKAIGGIFSLIQRGIIMLYRIVLGLANRAAEYRADRDACSMGYGIQLVHFLSIADPEGQRQLTMTEVLYRSHPPTEKRIARLTEQIRNESCLELK